MKTFRLIGMALLALCISFASCSSEELDEPIQDKYITVGLNCVGEYLNITDSPLSRAVTNDLYGIQIYTIENETLSETPYAYGVFNTLDNITVKLLENKTYRFKVSIAVNGYDKFVYWVNENEATNVGDPQFIYSVEKQLDVSGYKYWREQDRIFERFYGELDGYIPVKGETVSIETKRVSYGAKYIAENLTEGTLNINVFNKDNRSLFSISLTTTKLEDDNIYTFSNILAAYQDDNYSTEKNLVITWTKDNGEEIQLGTYTVRFKRNIRTTIRIKVEELSISNGITVTREDTPITDDDNEYLIEGGQIIVVPVNSAQ